jgi:predicted nucleic acid-binding protein
LAAADGALVWLEGLPFRFIEANRDLTMEAAKLKAQYALSYADCFAAVLAQRVDAAVVTGDEEFEQLERAGVVDIEWLPAKPKKASR